MALPVLIVAIPAILPTQRYDVVDGGLDKVTIATSKPVVIFDTSAINALYADPKKYERLGILRGAYFPRLAFSVIDEITATPDSYKNSQLYDLSLSFQNAGDCMLPFNYLLIAHIKTYIAESQYNWQLVNCSGNGLRQAIIDNRHAVTEYLTTEQRESNLATEKQYKDTLERFRKLLRSSEETCARFSTAEEFMKYSFGENGGSWTVGASLMNKAAEIISEEEASQSHTKTANLPTDDSEASRFTPEDARIFTNLCPPFQTFLSGLAQSEFTRVHDASVTAKQREKSAGRVDTYMAIYLPYCRHFVTNDSGQFNCLEPTAARSNVSADVLMYDNFWAKLPD